MVVISSDCAFHTARDRRSCDVWPIITSLRVSAPSSAYRRRTGGWRSYLLYTVYSTLSSFSSCAIVIGDPQPLPMLPRAGAVGGAPAPPLAGGASGSASH